ncbi:MAG: hypothetical protein HQK67_09775, partial [Desulfamplus sp.]|nr:hypothetical protein [Desulfamplus sp.]
QTIYFRWFGRLSGCFFEESTKHRIISRVKYLILKENICATRSIYLDDRYLIDFLENFYRIGYLGGLLQSENKLKKYHHSLVSKENAETGKIPLNSIKNAITMKAKQLYQNGDTRWHYEVAEEIRDIILKYLETKKRGITYNRSSSDYDEIIESIRVYRAKRLKSWIELIKLFSKYEDSDKKKKKKRDITLQAVKQGTPKRYIKGNN